MTIKAFDTDVVFETTVTRDGQPIDLTNCTVVFQMKLNVGGPLFSATAFPDADQTTNKGVVRFWSDAVGFPTGVGTYNQDWFVTTTDTPSSSSSSSGSWTFCFPEDSYNPVRIIENLNNGVTS